MKNTRVKSPKKYLERVCLKKRRVVEMNFFFFGLHNFPVFFLIIPLFTKKMKGKKILNKKI